MTERETELPIEAVLPELRAALRGASNAVLHAPPGAGKTTLVPLALLDEPWAGRGTIIMLEPRRLAVRAAAARMASLLGERVGETVGYRIRLDSRVGPETRIEIVTEAILTRRLQRDPELAGVVAVIFDEFHERNLHADLGLALSLEAQEALRPDLRLLVMSATLDSAPVARLMGGAPVIASYGRAFPVDIRHAPAMPRDTSRATEAAVTDAVRRAIAEEDGSVLAFLPGGGEIRRVAALLKDTLPQGVDVRPLYGALPPAEQDTAIAPPPPGRRKVVLATNIAETSLTIDGIRVVVDSGLVRRARFHPGSGMSRLETVRTSRASADQRCGRAGRTAPGVCYRLWPKAAEGGFPAFDAPEIAIADLAPLALDLAEWGVADASALRWLDPPPAAALGHARDLLTSLGALDRDGRITDHGRHMASLPLHPRLAHLTISAASTNLGADACLLAAILDEGDVLRGEARHDPDLRRRLASFVQPDPALDRKAAARVAELARRWRRRLDIPEQPVRPEATGRLLALAFPDRVAQRRPGGDGRFLLANGRGALLGKAEPLSGEAWLAVATVDDRGTEGRIHLAAPLSPGEVENLFATAIAEENLVVWNPRDKAVLAERRRRLGAIVLSSDPLPLASYEREVAAALCAGIRAEGLDCLPWMRRSQALRERLAFARATVPETAVGAAGWPDLSDEALLRSLEDWLGPHLAGMRRLQDLSRLDLDAIVEGMLDWPTRQTLDRIAPSHFEAPTGSRVAIDYDGGVPVLAIRLQEMFGTTNHPTVAEGRVPLTVRLLSPAQRPVQVTDDLPRFWRTSYGDVRKDLRGRYPKHPWPEDPATAPPTRHAKRRR